MTLEQVYFASQTIAALASIGALVFVGLQVRDSAKAVGANMAHAVSQGFSDLYRWQSDNPSALENLMAGLSDSGALTPAERARFICTLMAMLSQCQNAFDQWRVGHLRTDLWIGWEAVLMNLVQTPGGTEFWNERSYMFSKDFQNEVQLAMNRQPHPLAKSFGVMAVGRDGPTSGSSGSTP